MKGGGKTSVDPVNAMESSFESATRCLAARLLGVSNVSNTDQTMVLLYDDAKDSGYVAPRTGQAAGTKKRSGGRERLTICSEVSNGRFPSVIKVFSRALGSCN